MTEKLLKEAFQLCLRNAEQYIEDAELLIKNGSYGHAFAFVVLGEEEISKAFIYHMCSLGLLPDDLAIAVGHCRGSHLRKQTTAKVLIFVMKIIEILQGIVKTSIKYAGDDVNKRSAFTKAKLGEEINNIRENKHKILPSPDEYFSLEEDKEKGLYVDVNFIQQVSSSPESIGKDKAEKHLANVKRLLEFAQPLLMISIPSSDVDRLKVSLQESGVLTEFLNTDSDKTEH